MVGLPGDETHGRRGDELDVFDRELQDVRLVTVGADPVDEDERVELVARVSSLNLLVEWTEEDGGRDGRGGKD